MRPQEQFVHLPPRVDAGRLQLPYLLRTADGELALTEVVEFDRPLGVAADDPVVQLLHVAAGLSYYKAHPAPVVLDFPADPRVAPFLAELIRHGLAEYAHTTGRVDALTPPVTTPAGVRPAAARPPADPGAGPGRAVLVPLGGGKDSVVSVELLQGAGVPVHAFAVGEHPAIRGCAAAAGVPLGLAARTLDPGLAALTARTGLNGHVPVTAVNSLIALLHARAHGLSEVVMSNEGSADEPTLVADDGRVVNHQWSKSGAFERLLQAALPAGLRYFSLLRPWHEIAIAREFAASGRFDAVAVSCNRAYVRDPARRSAGWCLRCAKCAFVGLVLAPFLRPGRRTAMFGGDVVGSEAMATHLRALVGLTAGKPLECVGEVLESRAALVLLARTGEALPGFVAQVLAELRAGGLLPTDAEVEALFAPDPGALAALPAAYRPLLTGHRDSVPVA